MHEEIRLHEGPSEVFEELFLNKSIRFATVCAARGWGKSYFAAIAATTALFELFELDKDVPNKNVYIIAPTYDQVTDIYFPILAYDLGLEAIAISARRDLGRFVFANNVELRLVSYEAVERLRGKGAYFVVGDEISSWKKGITPKEAWEGVIQPCIMTRWSPERAKVYGANNPGRGLMISTPKGYNFFYDLFNYPETDARWGSFRYDYTQSPYLDQAEIELLKHTIDPLQWNSEYLARFEDSGNNVFYCFDRKKHVRDDLIDFVKPNKGNTGEDVHCWIDFNVGIQATSMFALRGNQMQVLDEKQGHPDTESLAKWLAHTYEGHKIIAYPDPTGKSRKTSAAVGVTDFSILKDHGIRIAARKKSPPIIDSVAAVNKQLLTAAGDINMFIHPRCKGTIASIERTKWMDNNPNLATIDKSEGIEHYSDGARYATEFLFPVRNHDKKVAKGFRF